MRRINLDASQRRLDELQREYETTRSLLDLRAAVGFCYAECVLLPEWLAKALEAYLLRAHREQHKEEWDRRRDAYIHGIRAVAVDAAVRRGERHPYAAAAHALNLAGHNVDRQQVAKSYRRHCEINGLPIPKGKPPARYEPDLENAHLLDE
jgi:hypothetical protein